MVEMVGDQSARGAERTNTVDEEEPIEVIYAEQMSLQISEQGSSDDPDDENPKTNTKSSVHGSRKGAALSRAAGTEDSDGTIPPVGNSGSKRKSTDDSAEVDTRGKRYKDRNRKKKEQGERLADAGFKIAEVIEKEHGRKMSREEQYDRCLEKFDEIGIRKSALSFAMSTCKKDSMRRKWILKNDRDTILEWIEDSIGPRSHAPPPPNPRRPTLLRVICMHNLPPLPLITPPSTMVPKLLKTYLCNCYHIYVNLLTATEMNLLIS